MRFAGSTDGERLYCGCNRTWHASDDDDYDDDDNYDDDDDYEERVVVVLPELEVTIIYNLILGIFYIVQ